MEPERQHAHHTNVDHERDGRLVHEGAGRRAEHTIGADPRRVAGLEGPVDPAQRSAAHIQH